MREHLLDGISMIWGRAHVNPGRVKNTLFSRDLFRSFFAVFLRAKCPLRVKNGRFAWEGCNKPERTAGFSLCFYVDSQQAGFTGGLLPVFLRGVRILRGKTGYARHAF